MKDCTFKPAVKSSQKETFREQNSKFMSENSRKDTSQTRHEVWEKLYKDGVEGKDWDRIQLEKTQLELRNCTFAPKINKVRSRSP